MEWVWTWGGKCFGCIDAGNLWTHDGKHVGKLSDDEIFGPDGRYLGEVMSGSRLITNIAKKNWRGAGFTPYSHRVGYVPYVDYVGYVMYAGYEDFPPPDKF